MGGSGRDFGQFERRPDEDAVIVPVFHILKASKFDTHCSRSFHLSKVPIWPEHVNPAFGKASEILAQAVRDLIASIPWGHHVLLLGRLADPPPIST